MIRIVEKMREGVSTRIFPGGVLLIAHQGKIVLNEAFGAARILPDRVDMACDTCFDLASLTKPLVTATAIALLLQQKALKLSDPVSRFLPAFSGDEKERVSLFHLLNHGAGLPDWKPYYQKIIEQDKQEKGFIGSPEAKKMVYRLAQQEPLINLPGENSRYSDIGFMLLGAVIEQISDLPLDVFYNRHIRPETASTASFLPTHQATLHPVPRFFAATEDLPWRNGVIQGAVHDDNAFVMGGVAGHAGLFSNALDLYSLVLEWVDPLKGSGFLATGTAVRFVTRQTGVSAPTDSSWGLGWDTPSPPQYPGSPNVSSSGHYFSSSSFGHLGYTGTSIWVDRTRDLIVILLTNRVHPSHEDRRIRTFRPALHDIIFEDIVGG